MLAALVVGGAVAFGATRRPKVGTSDRHPVRLAAADRVGDPGAILEPRRPARADAEVFGWGWSDQPGRAESAGCAGARRADGDSGCSVRPTRRSTGPCGFAGCASTRRRSGRRTRRRANARSTRRSRFARPESVLLGAHEGGRLVGTVSCRARDLPEGAPPGHDQHVTARRRRRAGASAVPCSTPDRATRAESGRPRAGAPRPS